MPADEEPFDAGERLCGAALGVVTAGFECLAVVEVLVAAGIGGIEDVGGCISERLVDMVLPERDTAPGDPCELVEHLGGCGDLGEQPPAGLPVTP